jgi:hypothetical protein
MPANSIPAIATTGSKAVLVYEYQANPAGKPAIRRRIPPLNGRALEILGHAIEYLADEYAFTVEQMGQIESDDPRVEAIQLLMALNRQVYYSCPEVEPLLKRLAGWLVATPFVPRSKSPSL